MKKDVTKIDIERLKELYSQGLSARDCAKELNCGKSLVCTWLKKLKMSRPKNQYVDKYGRFIKKGQILPPPTQKGENSYNWKGGISDRTYRRIAFENHPNECYHCKTTESLDVHHKDKNRYNNHPDNLRIVCRDCHCKIEHPRERDRFGRFI